MKTWLLSLIACICLLQYFTEGLSILEHCEDYECYKQKLDCKGRGSHPTEVTGNCCRACFKSEDERCGGIHDYEGICHKGLICQPTEVADHDPINKPVGACRRRLPKMWEKLIKDGKGKITPKLAKNISKILTRIRGLYTAAF